jgi:hypothetical protein
MTLTDRSKEPLDAIKDSVNKIVTITWQAISEYILLMAALELTRVGAGWPARPPVSQCRAGQLPPRDLD